MASYYLKLAQHTIYMLLSDQRPLSVFALMLLRIYLCSGGSLWSGGSVLSQWSFSAWGASESLRAGGSMITNEASSTLLSRGTTGTAASLRYEEKK